MYCRKCGEQLPEGSYVCPHCGTEFREVEQRPYAEQYKAMKNEAKQADKAKMDALEKKLNKKELESLKNPYIIPCFGAGLVALILCVFPWRIVPVDGIGTSLPMRIAILICALLSVYHGTKGQQVNNLFKKDYDIEIKPKLLRYGRMLGTVTAILGLFGIFMF